MSYLKMPVSYGIILILLQPTTVILRLNGFDSIAVVTNGAEIVAAVMVPLTLIVARRRAPQVLGAVTVGAAIVFLAMWAIGVALINAETDAGGGADVGTGAPLLVGLIGLIVTAFIGGRGAVTRSVRV